MRIRQIILGLIGLLWLFVTIVFYYLAHKPLNNALLLSLAQATWRIIVVLVIFSVSGGIGNRIIRIGGINPLLQIFLQTCLGCGILSLSIFLGGISFGINLLFLTALLLLPALFLRKYIHRWWVQFQYLPQMWGFCDRFTRVLIFVISLILLFSLTTALAPPVGYDALTYHLVLPDAYLDLGRISHIPWIVMSGIPQNGEMLFTITMAFGGSDAGPLIGWFFGILTILGLLGFLIQYLDSRSAFVGVASLACSYTVIMSLSRGTVDSTGLFFSLGLIISLNLWCQTNDIWLIALCGVFAGLVSGTQYTGVSILIPGLFVILWQGRLRKSRLILDICVYLLSACCICLPWIIKNWVSTGNPFYPFFFEAGAITDIRLQFLKGINAWGDWRDAVFLPMRATYFGLDAMEGYESSIGPLLLGLGALFWIPWGRMTDTQRMFLLNCGVITISGWIIWVVANQLNGFFIRSTYYYPFFLAISGLTASGYWGMSQISFLKIRMQRVISVLVMLVLVFNMGEVVFSVIKQGSPLVLMGLKSESDYLVNNLGWYAKVMDSIRQLSDENSVLLLFEQRSYYCRPRCFPDETNDRWKRDWQKFKDPGLLLSQWKKEGFTHILYNKYEAEIMQDEGDNPYTQADWDGLDSLITLLPKWNSFGDSYLLFKIP